MHLHAYLIALSNEDRLSFAETCGTTLNYLWKIARGFEKKRYRPHPELAARIEAASNQKVRRWESIPERWHLIWPELVGSPGAPIAPSEPLYQRAA